MSSSSSSPLPLELVLAVARHLPPAALPALALASTAFADVAQRVLYRHLTVRNLALVPLLARRPRLARHVRSLYLAVDPAAPLFASFYAALAAALRNLTELRSLHLLVHPDASWVLPPVPCPNLVHFTSSFSLDHALVRFLERTPALRELELDAVPCPAAPLPVLAPGAIPRLELFIGSARAAGAIVPGRPVSAIHLMPSALAQDDILLLARSTAPVLVLSAAITSTPVPFLHLLHRHLPHLAYLRVMSTHTLSHPPTPDFYEQVASALDAFSHLDAFELSGIHWGSPRKRDSRSDKRVWQSSPLSCSSIPPILHIDPM